MKDCVFCGIVEGKIPAYRVYEDEKYLGFLDVNPLNQGHTLLIPKTHYRWVDDVPEFGEYFEAAKKIGLAQKRSLNPLAVFYITAGFGAKHAHIHIIPRFENDGHTEIPTSEGKKNYSKEEMEKIAKDLANSVKEVLI